MKPRHKSNLNYHSHNRENKPISNDQSNPSENTKRLKVLFDDLESKSIEVINKKNSEENSKNQNTQNNNFESEQNIENNNNFNSLKHNNLDNSRTVTASFFINNSMITNGKGIKQLRRNRYNKTYTQIQLNKNEHSSKSIEEHSTNSNLNASKRGNNHSNTNNNKNNFTNSNSESKNFEHSNCRHFRTNLGANTNNCSMGQKDFKDEKKHGFNSINTQCSNFADKNIIHFYSNTNNSHQNTNSKKSKISLNHNNNNKNSSDNYINGKKSKSMNQDELRNNLLKINLTSSLTPHQNCNMSSSIMNLLTETNRMSKNQNKIIQDSNVNNNKIDISSKSAKNEINTFDSPKSIKEIDHKQSPINKKSKRSNLRDSQTNFDLEEQSSQAKMFFSSENFYKQKQNKNPGIDKLLIMNETDPNAFKSIKNPNSNKNTISFDSPSYAEKGDLSQRNIFNNPYNKSNEKALNFKNSSCFPQIKSVKFYEAIDGENLASIEKIYDYPKRENNQNNLFDVISSPTNSVGNKLITKLKTVNAASPPKQISTKKSINKTNYNNNNNNFVSLEEYDKQDINNNELLIAQNTKGIGFSYNSPQNKSEIAKQGEYVYNNPRTNSNNYNATEGDQLTLIEEADEKIAGHISEENINVNRKDSNSNKNLIVVKIRSSDKSVHSKRKVETEAIKQTLSASEKAQNKIENKKDTIYAKEKGNVQIEKSKIDELKAFNNIKDEVQSKEVIFINFPDNFKIKIYYKKLKIN
jgi:hypothetical protein